MRGTASLAAPDLPNTGRATALHRRPVGISRRPVAIRGLVKPEVPDVADDDRTLTVDEERPGEGIDADGPHHLRGAVRMVEPYAPAIRQLPARPAADVEVATPQRLDAGLE